MTLPSSAITEIAPGMEVYGYDGEHLGTVKEVSGISFKVTEPKTKDYWLTTDFVSEASTEGVKLVLNRDQIDQYKMDSAKRMS